ncbi:hypothetical protein MNBD_GAMMA12-3802 [hydrothermal vent metagenome]|uniref:Uncharacterized protein n=1 Tax=hydrothermal vent metagenome TaxID=652676 RepID=A0A3B0YSM2_9ZZZZ
MKVIDQAKNFWYLFEEGGGFLLDVNCSHNFVSYDFMLFLDEKEIELYNNNGNEYLNELANQINYLSPISKLRNSKYKARNVHDEYAEKSVEAIDLWRKWYNN